MALDPLAPIVRTGLHSVVPYDEPDINDVREMLEVSDPCLLLVTILSPFVPSQHIWTSHKWSSALLVGEEGRGGNLSKLGSLQISSR